MPSFASCRRCVLCISFIILVAAHTRADVVTLKGGGSVHGKVMTSSGSRARTVTVKTSTGTSIVFDRAAVEQIMHGPNALPKPPAKSPPGKPASARPHLTPAQESWIPKVRSLVTRLFDQDRDKSRQARSGSVEDRRSGRDSGPRPVLGTKSQRRCSPAVHHDRAEHPGAAGSLPARRAIDLRPIPGGSRRGTQGNRRGSGRHRAGFVHRSAQDPRAEHRQPRGDRHLRDRRSQARGGPLPDRHADVRLKDDGDGSIGPVGYALYGQHLHHARREGFRRNFRRPNAHDFNRSGVRRGAMDDSKPGGLCARFGAGMETRRARCRRYRPPSIPIRRGRKWAVRGLM